MYKSVVIIGQDCPITYNLDNYLNNKYSNSWFNIQSWSNWWNEDLLIIGDIENGTNINDIKNALNGKIDNNTRFDVISHGAFDSLNTQKHYTYLQDYYNANEADNCSPYTIDLFRALSSCNPSASLDIHIWSCQSGGVSSEDASVLPNGSTISVCTGSPDLYSYSIYDAPITLHGIQSRIEHNYNIYKEAIYQLCHSPTGSKFFFTDEQGEIVCFDGSINYEDAINNKDYLYNQQLSFFETYNFDNSLLVDDCDAYADNLASYLCINNDNKSLGQLLDTYDISQEAKDFSLLLSIDDTEAPCLDTLLANGANPHNKVPTWWDDSTMDPFLISIENNNTYILEKFLQYGANANVLCTDSGFTATHYAAYTGKAEALQLLLQYGADPLLEDQNGHNVYDVAEDEHIKDILNNYSNQEIIFDPLSNDMLIEAI